MKRFLAGLAVTGLLVGGLAAAGSPAAAAPVQRAASGWVAATTTAAPIAVIQTCQSPAASDAVCGYVPVPLDRSKPAGAKIRIAFEFYPATDDRRPAVSTVVYSVGGPGNSNIALAGLWLSLLASVRPRENVLAIDHRGIGKSAAIDCPGLQHVQGDQQLAARNCGALLGDAAYRYGSADVAQDVEAVRQALRLGKIDYFGVSYGAVDVRAYAYRYPHRLRAAVLDSPYDSKDAAFVRTLPSAMARIATLVCRRSPSCSATHPDPARTFNQLVASVRQHPVTGTGYDATGTAHRVTIDESALLSVLYNNYFADPSFLNQGEIFAAADALHRGDHTPLLRLVAESPSPTDFGDAAGGTSVGADYAVFCADSDFPWNRTAPEATRQAQYDAALDRIPRGASTPFSTRTWAGFIASQPVLLIPGADACVPWSKPGRRVAPFPVNQRFPSNVPALLLGGGLDYLDIATERAMLPLFKRGRFVAVANAGHVTTYWSPCATAIANGFLATLRVGDTSCAADPKGAMAEPFFGATGMLQLQGVGRFPVRAADALPGLPAPGDRGIRLDHQIAGVAWSTALDAIYRIPRLGGSSTGRALRGGGFTVTKTAAGTAVTLTAARFAADVQVSGQVVLGPSNMLTGTLTLQGPAGVHGWLRVAGTLWDPSRPSALVQGWIGGRHIAVRALSR